MEAITKERFLARLYAMRSKQANNSRAITQEDYDNIIKKLKLLDNKVKSKSIPGFTSNDYNLANTHEILTVEKNGTIIERLVRPSKEDPNKKLRYITIENMFEPMYKVHQESGHGARDVMHPRLMDIYANITQVQCTALIASCEHCQKKKLRQQKGIVVKVW